MRLPHEFNGEAFGFLADLNDDTPMTHAEIADYIESDPENVFVESR